MLSSLESKTRSASLSSEVLPGTVPVRGVCVCKGALLVGSAALVGESGDPSHPHIIPRLCSSLQTALTALGVLSSGLIAGV